MRVSGKRIMVKQRLTEEVSKGGIVMAGEQQALPYGDVIQLGPDAEDYLDLSPGEIVLFNEIGAIPLGHLLKDHVLIEPDDILAVLDEEEVK
jgi:co-chaperonin GroES (HSP10)